MGMYSEKSVILPIVVGLNCVHIEHMLVCTEHCKMHNDTEPQMTVLDVCMDVQRHETPMYERAVSSQYVQTDAHASAFMFVRVCVG